MSSPDDISAAAVARRRQDFSPRAACGPCLCRRCRGLAAVWLPMRATLRRGPAAALPGGGSDRSWGAAGCRAGRGGGRAAGRRASGRLQEVQRRPEDVGETFEAVDMPADPLRNRRSADNSEEAVWLADGEEAQRSGAAATALSLIILAALSRLSSCVFPSEISDSRGRTLVSPRVDEVPR